MRILKVQFENINSLKGKWSIDFTDPSYKLNHDIFVICGPTGSGKTTILDAITLALYGKTPRQNKINSNSNEVMTRGTGKCSASVTYECKEGKFTSKFTQNRADSKSDGNLQSISYYIYDSTGKELKNGKSTKELEEETEKIVHLNFEQFTRSIMLAQGEFSKFLTCKDTERAEILSKLNGSEKYAKIGKKIGEYCSQAKTNKTNAEDKLKNYEGRILSEEKVQECKNTSNSLKKEIKDLNENIHNEEIQLSLWNQYESFENAVKKAFENSNNAKKALDGFKDNDELLKKAQSAQYCESAYESLKLLRNSQIEISEKIEKLKKDLKAASESYEIACAQFDKSNQNLTEKTDYQKTMQPVFDEVRKLDIQLENISQNLTAAEKRKAAAQKTFDDCADEIREGEKKLASIKQALSEASDYAETHKSDEKLVSLLPKAEVLMSAIHQLIEKTVHLNKDKSSVSKKINENTLKLSEVVEKIRQLTEKTSAYFSKNSIFIAGQLKKMLLPGKACPVCGSKEHPACGIQNSVSAEENADSENVSSINVQTLTEDVSAFTKDLDSLNEKKQSLDSELSALQSQLDGIGQNLTACESEKKQNIEKINELFAEWKLSLTDENSEKSFETLNNLSVAFTENKQKLEDLNSEKDRLEIQLKNLSEKQNDTKTVLESETENCNQISSKKDSVMNERSEKFGDKNVEEESNALQQEIDVASKEVDRLRKLQADSQNKKIDLDAKKNQKESDLIKVQPELAAAEKVFSEKLSEKSFASEEDFLKARLEKKQFDELSAKSEELKNSVTKAESALDQAQKSFDGFKAENSLDKSKEILTAELENLNIQLNDKNDQLINVESQLKTNSQNHTAYENAKKEYDKAKENFDTWENMRKWAGTNEGKDFSVFVQSLAFNTLLNLANSYLSGITNRFQLVQKEAGSLEFEINDKNFSNNYPVTNLSGGERFIVSLALALGIAKFASRSIRVDSLFLDEGFGTLSGSYLTEAINALKRLSQDNKMLGIITHVDSVINEFPQKIKVQPAAGGYSTIEGSGITRNVE